MPKMLYPFIGSLYKGVCEDISGIGFRANGQSTQSLGTWDFRIVTVAPVVGAYVIIGHFDPYEQFLMLPRCKSTSFAGYSVEKCQEVSSIHW